MARITLRQLLDHAAEHDYGVPAFNINNMEQALAIMDAASSLDAPVIIQASRGARSYANDVMLKHMMDAITEIYPQIPVCVHLDHGDEGKLSHDQLLTNPDEAVKFVKETKVDALAIAMGTSHGAYKFTRKPDGDILAMNVIEEIHRKLPNMHLVMHGSSSVPQELQDIINANGGRMKPTWGVPVSEIQRGIKNGVRKINIDTDNRMAMTGQIRKVLNDNPEEFDPRKYLKPAMEAMAKLCKQRLAEFNTAGQASKIRRVLTTAEMAKRYGKGELDPKVA